MLRGLLRAIAGQETQGRFGLSVVVVDNDGSQSARAAVEVVRRETRMAVTYTVESRRNIALARNKAIDEATGTHLAFIDDDETPQADWLLCLLRTCQIYQADGVLGPVVPRFETPPARWVIKGKLFDRPSHTTGHRLDWRNTRTGNVLLRRHVIEGPTNRFDPAFGSGGEDRDFFRRMIAKGYRFIWCQEAAVYETIPAERWKKSVLFRRALLRGQVSLRHPGGKTSRVVKSIVAVMIYTSLLPLLVLVRYHLYIRYLIRVGDHLGRLMAAVGFRAVKDNYVSG